MARDVDITFVVSEENKQQTQAKTAYTRLRAVVERAEKDKTELYVVVENAKNILTQLEIDLDSSEAVSTELASNVVKGEEVTTALTTAIATATATTTTLATATAAAKENLASLQSENYKSQELLNGVERLNSLIANTVYASDNGIIEGIENRNIITAVLGKDKTYAHIDLAFAANYTKTTYSNGVGVDIYVNEDTITLLTAESSVNYINLA